MGQEVSRKQRSLWEVWIGCPLWLQISMVVAISALIGLVGHEWGVANDCLALGVKQDGQCGLATAMGGFFGLVGGLIFLMVGALFTWVAAIRRSERAKEERK